MINKIMGFFVQIQVTGAFNQDMNEKGLVEWLKNLIDHVKDKNVVFITTKNIDYIRNSQELKILKENAKHVDKIYSKSKSYPVRILQVWLKILLRGFGKYDTVFVGFSPQLIMPIWWWKFKKNTVVIDFFISVYDTMAFDRKKVTPKSMAGRFCKWIDCRTIKNANHIIADTKAHGKYFSSEFGADMNTIEVLYIVADDKIYYRRPQKKKKEDEGKFVVVYFGSILPLQGIDVIIKAAAKLKNRDDIKFYIVGPVKDEKVPENVVNIPWLSQKELAEYIAMSDLCLAGHFNKHNNKANRTIPGKAYIYELMGRPMILGDNPATHELFEEDGKHFFVEMSNPQALADKIAEVADKAKKTGE